MKKNNFVFSNNPEPHRARTKNILKQHPQIRNLIGKNVYTFHFILLLVGILVTLSWLVSDQPWWLIVLVAYFVGAFADHGLFVMIHEATHKLIFKNKNA